MKKENFLNLVYKKCRFANDKEIKDVYDGMMIAIEQAVLDGEEVSLQGICTIKATAKCGRAGRNPKTGEALEIPDRMAPRFIASGPFRKAVREMKYIPPAKKDDSTDEPRSGRRR